jgi:WD40 repeat protein/serine/threonine protein kinase
VLSDFAQGRLSAEEMDAIAAHIASCPDCASQVDHIDDDFVNRMRNAATLGSPVPAATVPLKGPGATSELPEPGTFPGYVILSELGRGGMGIVYLARHLALQRLVALKVVREQGTAAIEELARLRTEAEALAKIRHPHIVQVFEVGESRAAGWSRSLPFFTMEYLPAGSLASHLAGIPQSPRLAARFVELLAHAIDAAHRAGVVHRDLKPGNILLDYTDQRDATAGPFRLDTAVPRITDFGLAKWRDQEHGATGTGAVLGTPGYMAPEQAAGKKKDVGIAADIHGLGAILYELLTGRPPFRADSTTEALLQVLLIDAVPPRRLVAGIPRDIETIALKCLEKNPIRRYESAAALAEDLRRFQTDEPIRARPTGPLGRLVKWVRREPTIAALLGAIVTTLVVGAALVTSEWLRADNERKRAEGETVLARAAEEKANTERAGAEQARSEAEGARTRAEQAELTLTLDQALTLCQRGEVPEGLRLLVRGLELSQRPAGKHLEHAVRVNIANWLDHVPRTSRRWKHGESVAKLAFSPNGKWLASAGSDGMVRFWDTETGAESLPALSHPGVIPLVGRHYLRDVTWSPDGLFVATGNHDQSARIWDFKTRKLVGQPLRHPNTESVWRARFSNDGKTLYTVAEDGVLRAWDTTTRTSSVVLTPSPASPGFNTMTANASGDWFAIGGGPGIVSFKSLNTAKLFPAIELTHDSLVETMAFTPDDRFLLVGTRGGKLSVWDLDERSSHVQLRVLPLGSGVRGVAVNADGSRFVTGTSGGIVSLWDTATTTQISVLVHSNAGITDVEFHPGGRVVAVGEDDGTIRLLELGETELVGHPMRSPDVFGHTTSETHTVTFNKTGTMLLSSAATSSRLWDVRTGEPVGPEMSGTATATSAALSPDGKLVVIGRSKQDMVDFYDGHTGALIHSESIPNTLRLYENILATVFSPDGTSLVTYRNQPRNSPFASSSGWVWDTTTSPPRRQRQILHGFPGQITNIVFSPDGSRLALACADGTVRFWDIKTDKAVGEVLRHSAPVNAVVFSPDGMFVATGCRDGTAQVWDASTGKPAAGPLPHGGVVKAVAFSPDGQTILTGSTDGLAQFWERASGVRLGVPLRHPMSVCSVCFSKDGQFVATGDGDRTARIWRVPRGPIEGTPQQVRALVENRTHQSSAR